MKCYIKEYDKCKYEEDSIKVAQYDLEGVESFRVMKALKVLDEKGLPIEDYDHDPCYEYLIICFEDGSIKTYKNSMVDLFKY